jgi:Fe-S cluster assembly protein SufD
VTTGKDLADSWIHISHSEPGCLSDQLFKAVAGDESTAVFSGKIFVAKDAQKTSAYQTSRNIVLSDHASVYTRPQLEIYADDVKCSHGATTGKIDNEALFYLRTRGIPENAARLLLLEAFMMDVLEKAEIEDFRNTSRIHILRKLSALIKKEKTL